MAKGKKFIGQMVYINNEDYHNKRYKSAYIYVRDIVDRGSGVHVLGFDSRGNWFDYYIDERRMYKELEVLNVKEYEDLARDFIRIVFKHIIGGI